MASGITKLVENGVESEVDQRKVESDNGEGKEEDREGRKC
jgi:hypothetical protein